MRNEAERLAAELPKGNRPKLFPFYQTLKSPGISFICEVKKASPSKGVIAEEFPYLEIAKEYENSRRIRNLVPDGTVLFSGKGCVPERNHRACKDSGIEKRFYG